ncbi:MAG: glucose dehydrogenase [Thermomicrobiales bacterium]|nr:MAG: glucose dehydrogenase [Thermomicrobiales bacterium]
MQSPYNRTFLHQARLLGTTVLLMLSLSQLAPRTTAAQAPTVQPGGDLPGEPAIQLVKIAEGLADPVAIASSHDDTGRLFIVERVGRIRVLLPDGTLLPTPFLDLTELVQNDYLEQGLLGLAFHPNYRENGLFYVNFTDYHTNGDTFIMEFHVSADDPNVADRTSGRLLLDIDQPYVNHNGGTIRFGPDGYLWIGMGDGGMGGDPYGYAQNMSSLLGKLLRIDVAPRGDAQYGIPEDNPYADARVVQSNAITDVIGETSGLSLEAAYYTPGNRREIWAAGLRNPWQFSWDRATGDLYLTDVGQITWEEINVIPAGTPGGLNFGWDWLEASHCYPAQVTDCPRSQVGELPVAEYKHGPDGCSITGIGVYRGTVSPSLDGIYFNSDWCSGKFWGLKRDDAGQWQYQELLDTTLFVTGGGEDDAGELYVTSCTCEFSRKYDPEKNPGGAVWHLVAADQVPGGAETAPLEGTPSPEPSPAASPVAAWRSREAWG